MTYSVYIFVTSAFYRAKQKTIGLRKINRKGNLLGKKTNTCQMKCSFIKWFWAVSLVWISHVGWVSHQHRTKTPPSTPASYQSFLLILFLITQNKLFELVETSSKAMVWHLFKKVLSDKSTFRHLFCKMLCYICTYFLWRLRHIFLFIH